MEQVLKAPERIPKGFLDQAVCVVTWSGLAALDFMILGAH